MRMTRSFYGISGQALALFFLLHASGCATSTANHDLSPQEVARYQEAIDKNPSSVPMGTEITVSVSGELPAPAPVPQTVARDFTVPAADYDAFFAESPAVILGRLTLDPVRDGNTLLGYRIVKFNRERFDGVDLEQNDIIVAIDGKLPQTPDDYFAAWEKLRAADTATLTVLRSVNTFTLTWKKAN